MVSFLGSSGNSGDDMQLPKSPTSGRPSFSSKSPTSKNSKFLSPTQFASSLQNFADSKRRGSLVAETPETNKLRIVLIGGGGSGKTTIFKQRKILFGSGFTEKENEQASLIVHTELLNAMYSLAFELFNGTYTTNENVIQIAHDFLKIVSEKCNHNEHALINCIELIIENAQTWKTFFTMDWFNEVSKINPKFSSLFNFSVNPFFEEYDRVMHSDFSPLEKDHVLFQKKTTGIIESSFTYMNSFIVYLLDSGGQRNERKKWSNMFIKPVDSVCFVASLSDFTKMCYENNELNRLDDSLSIFAEWIESSATRDIRDFRVLLTHADELENVKFSPQTISFLQSHHISYGSSKEIIDSIIAKYRSLDKHNRLSDVSVVNSTDTEQMREYLTTTLNTIIDGR